MVEGQTHHAVCGESGVRPLSGVRPYPPPLLRKYLPNPHGLVVRPGKRQPPVRGKRHAGYIAGMPTERAQEAAGDLVQGEGALFCPKGNPVLSRGWLPCWAMDGAASRNVSNRNNKQEKFERFIISPELFKKPSNASKGNGSH